MFCACDDEFRVGSMGMEVPEDLDCKGLVLFFLKPSDIAQHNSIRTDSKGVSGFLPPVSIPDESFCDDSVIDHPE